MRLPITALLWLLPLTVSLAQQQPAPRLIRVDAGRPAGALNRSWQLCVGAGRANEGLRADWQRQLATVRKECGFRYLRFHGLLHDDMGVYQENRQGQPVYNFQYVDQLYDYLLSLGVKPFVELSFMPAALRSQDKTVFWWRANVSPPKDYARWEALIRALVQHWEQRYGRRELESWYFEVWNEPNYPAFFSGTQADYFQLYASTVRAVKSVSATYRVGGPASSGVGWIDETLQYCAQNQVPLDFISTHDYGVREGALDEFGQGQQQLGDPNGIARNVQAVRRKITASAFPRAELHITEWSTSYSSRDPVHDSYHSAAYLLNTLRQTRTAAHSMSYWTFTDIFEEAGPAPTPFHGGFGLLNLQGIRKPAYFAYKYLQQLGPVALPATDSAAWAARRSPDEVQLLFWDFSPPALGAETDQQYFRREQPAAPRGPVTVQIEHLPAGRYRLEVHRTGYEQNDAYTAYLRQGRPAQLSREQQAQLTAQTQDAPALRKTVTVGPSGQLRETLTLRSNDVVLLTLQRQP